MYTISDFFLMICREKQIVQIIKKKKTFYINKSQRKKIAEIV